MFDDCLGSSVILESIVAIYVKKSTSNDTVIDNVSKYEQLLGILCGASNLILKQFAYCGVHEEKL